MFEIPSVLDLVGIARPGDAIDGRFILRSHTKLELFRPLPPESPLWIVADGSANEARIVERVTYLADLLASRFEEVNLVLTSFPYAYAEPPELAPASLASTVATTLGRASIHSVSYLGAEPDEVPHWRGRLSIIPCDAGLVTGLRRIEIHPSVVWPASYRDAALAEQIALGFDAVLGIPLAAAPSRNKTLSTGGVHVVVSRTSEPAAVIESIVQFGELFGGRELVLVVPFWTGDASTVHGVLGSGYTRIVTLDACADSRAIGDRRVFRLSCWPLLGLPTSPGARSTPASRDA